MAQAQQIVADLKSKYNYDPGNYNQGSIFTNSNKFFGRLDWNINSHNSLVFRTIYTSGEGQNLERTTTNFQFASTDFTQHTTNLNMVAELKSTIHNNLFNSAIVSFINVHDYRDYPTPTDANGATLPQSAVPFIDIGNGAIWLGTWREASVYNQKQKTFEFTDNVTWIKGVNKFTFGTHNEFYNIYYGFVNSFNGRWQYSSLANFLADKPSRIRGAYVINPTGDNNGTIGAQYDNTLGAKFNVNLLSAYAQDEITATSNLRLTIGVRLDYPNLPNQPPVDSNVTKTVDYINANPVNGSSYTHTSFNQLNNKWLNQASFSPRFGFNWDVNSDQKFIVRGGSGIFVGRMPFAWLGYAYTLSGSNYGTIDYSPAAGTVVGLAADPNHLRDTVSKYGGAGATARHEVDLVDNNFKLPTVWRSNIAADIKFGNGYKFTADFLYTKTLYDVKFQQINLKDTFIYLPTGPTQTPLYYSSGASGQRVNTSFSNAYLLSNTTEGYRYNITGQLSKNLSPFALGAHQLGVYAMVAYTYGMSKDLSNGIRNSFQSNYEVNPAPNPENPQLAYSNFDLRHRIVGAASGNLTWNEHNTTSLAFFFSSASGSPYSLIYNSTPFGNSSSATSIYIPTIAEEKFANTTNPDGSVYTGAQQAADFDQFIDNDKYLKTRRGMYAERNGPRTPWNTELDMKLMHEFRFKVGEKRTNSIQLSLDLFNVLNLFSNSLGHQFFVTNVNNYTVNVLNIVNDASGLAPNKTGYVPTYTFIKPPFNGQYYTVDPISSRWQAQFGIKYNF